LAAALAAALLAAEAAPAQEVFAPSGLEVDFQVLASDGNGVFEPGEMAYVAPEWTNHGTTATVAQGTASNLTGPAGPTYNLSFANADYGSVAAGASASCQDAGLCYQMDIGPLAVERPGQHWDATFDERLTDGSEHSWTLHVGDSFLDVPRSSVFYRFVETMLHHSITAGCTATAFCPATPTQRAQMPVFVLRALEGPGYAPPPCTQGAELFDDVPAGNVFCPWIEELSNRGAVSGCGAGNYCPGSPVTRAQMAVFLLRTLEGSGYAPPSCMPGAETFDDVPAGSAFCPWIEDLSNRGITGGCSSNPPQYCPADPVTRAQMSAFITRTFGLVLYEP
jgi:hypothetical protein